ncbi:MAG: alpha/beta fold hydrolase [Microcoleus sp. PH2017_20_SFW_D_A]|nr:alpha/beta fold hydrolase [Microcoleus sp. PH2017_20_SFW_D_A]
MSNFFTPEFNNESAIAPWNASLEPTKAIIPQLDANRVLTGGVGEEVNLPTLTPEAYDNIILPDASLTRMASAVSTDSNSSLPDSSIDLLTGQAMSEVYGDLSKFAADPDFAAKMNVAFGENWDAAGAKALAEGWFQGDFSDIPPVKVVSSAEIDGANGAFAAATDTIYLSKEFLTQNAANPAAVADVLLEEIGHSVDARLNVTDSPGDEGAIFAAVVQGKELTQGELQALKGKDDTANVVLSGEHTTIEMSQQGWVLASWKNRDFNGKPDQIIYQNGNRSDDKNGIDINWGKGSPFSIPNTDIIEQLDNFVTFGYTTDIFEAGRNYNFRVSADDEIVIAVKKNDTDSWKFISPPELQTFPNGIFKNYSWSPTQNGSYDVGFLHRENTGDAGVNISWKKDSISVENRSFDVNLSLYSKGEKIGIPKIETANSGNIDPNKDTVVVIHGRGTGSEDTDITTLATTAAESQYYPNSQVLHLDWKEAANDGAIFTPPYDAAKRIRPVADWATKRLKELGIDPEKTILLGHSLGSYVASEIGRIGGKVKELVALDPAWPGGTDDRSYDIDGNNPGDDRAVDFSAVATKSIALVASDAAGGLAGDNDKAASADYSYIVSFRGYPGANFATPQRTAAYHKGVAGVFNYVMSKNQSDQKLTFPSLVDFDRVDNIGNVWSSQFKFERAHEGVISADLMEEKKPRINSLSYIDSNGNGRVIWNS